MEIMLLSLKSWNIRHTAREVQKIAPKCSLSSLIYHDLSYFISCSIYIYNYLQLSLYLLYFNLHLEAHLSNLACCFLQYLSSLWPWIQCILAAAPTNLYLAMFKWKLQPTFHLAPFHTPGTPKVSQGHLQEKQSTGTQSQQSMVWDSFVCTFVVTLLCCILCWNACFIPSSFGKRSSPHLFHLPIPCQTFWARLGSLWWRPSQASDHAMK